MARTSLDQLERVLELARGQAATPKNIERVAAVCGGDAAQWAFTQWALRDRARAKFALAGEMLFDRDGLEMASHEELAESINPMAIPLDVRAADLTAGIGADLVGLAKGREAVGYETDPDRAFLCRHNLRIHGRLAEVREEDSLTSLWDFDYAYADPARRLNGRRTLTPSDFSPPLGELTSRMRALRRGVVKLTPMLSDPLLASLSQDRVFVSHRGECKECLVTVGTEPWTERSGVWSFEAGRQVWLPGETPLGSSLTEPLAFVHEADPAVVRAHGLGNYGLPGLGDSNGYLTSGSVADPSVGLASFETRWTGSWRPAAVKQVLKSLSARVDAVKTRGVAVDVRKAASQVQTEGGEALVLILYPVSKQVRAVIGSRVS